MPYNSILVAIYNVLQSVHQKTNFEVLFIAEHNKTKLYLHIDPLVYLSACVIIYEHYRCVTSVNCSIIGKIAYLRYSISIKKRSFINMLNSKGPSTEPCGTPIEIFFDELNLEPVLTL